MLRDARKPTAKTKAGKGRGRIPWLEKEEGWGSLWTKAWEAQVPGRSLDVSHNRHLLWVLKAERKEIKVGSMKRNLVKLCSTRQTGGERGCRLPCSYAGGGGMSVCMRVFPR